METLRISLFGLPGAGKGTQAEMLRDHFKVPHISTGAIFRAIQNGQDSLAQEVKAVLASGNLVSDQLVTQIAFQRLREPDCHGGYILDGFPRTLPQAVELTNSEFALRDFIVISVPEEIIVKRLTGRRVCPSCQSIFHVNMLGGASKCPKDGHELTHREDDRPEAVVTRLKAFEANLLPVVNFYESIGKLRVVNGDGHPEEVFHRIIAGMDPM